MLYLFSGMKNWPGLRPGVWPKMLSRVWRIIMLCSPRSLINRNQVRPYLTKLPLMNHCEPWYWIASPVATVFALLADRTSCAANRPLGSSRIATSLSASLPARRMRRMTPRVWFRSSRMSVSPISTWSPPPVMLVFAPVSSTDPESVPQ